MTQRTPRSLIHKLEKTKVPLEQLKAIRSLREYLDRCELLSLVEARRLGCTVSEIADALGVIAVVLVAVGTYVSHRVLHARNIRFEAHQAMK